MAVKAQLVTLVAATAKRVANAINGTAAVPTSVIVYNATATTLYLGGADVTDAGATQGLPIATLTFSPGIDLVSGDDLYAYSTAGGTINVLALRQ